LKTRLIEPALKMIDHAAGGFHMVKSPIKMVLCILLSVFIWIVQAASFYLFSLGTPGISLGFAEISAVMVIICFFIALPSAPGFWGLWEAGGVFALTLFGVSTKDAAGYALTVHVIQLAPVIVAGLLSAAFTGVDLRRFSSTQAAIPDKRAAAAERI
jgi:hypothetical protein